MRNLFITSEPMRGFHAGMQGFSINPAYVFFWNPSRIWYWKIGEPDERFARLGLTVSEADARTSVKKVRTGSSSDEVAIWVR